MKIEFLHAEKIDNNTIRIFVKIDNKETFFDVPKFMFLNDIKNKISK